MKNKKSKIISDAICGILMLLSIIVYLILGFVIHFWHPGWLIIVCSSLACGIISIITNLVFDLKNANNESAQEQPTQDK